MTYEAHMFFRACGPAGLQWRGAFTLGGGLEIDKQRLRAQMITICQVRLERARNADASPSHYVASGVIPALAVRLRRMQSAYKAAAKRLTMKGPT